MNDTNRGLNRVLLIAIGLVLVALGAAAVLVFAWPTAAPAWTAVAETARSWMEDVAAASVISGTTLDGLVIAVLLALAIAITLLIIALTRLGGGRSNTVLPAGAADGTRGRIRVRPAFAADALRHSLQARDEILFSRVTASIVRSQPVLHVSVTPRQNTSPRQVLDDVQRLVTNLAAITGDDTPTYVSIHSGLRARLAHDRRRLA